MSPYEFVIMLVIAGVCGSVAESLTGYTRGGMLFSVGIGLLGGFLGESLAAEMGMPALMVIRIDDQGIDVAWTIIGAVVLVFALSFLRSLLGLKKSAA